MWSHSTPMSLARSLLGKSGEQLACDHLAQMGYHILVRNFRNRLGEIDIIAEESGCLVFVEVKTRRDLKHGHPAESLTPRKQQQICKVALSYLNACGGAHRPARFDVVSILVRPEGIRLEVVKNAFSQCYGL